MLCFSISITYTAHTPQYCANDLILWNLFNWTKSWWSSYITIFEVLLNAKCTLNCSSSLSLLVVLTQLEIFTDRNSKRMSIMFKTLIRFSLTLVWILTDQPVVTLYWLKSRKMVSVRLCPGRIPRAFTDLFTRVLSKSRVATQIVSPQKQQSNRAGS